MKCGSKKIVIIFAFLYIIVLLYHNSIVYIFRNTNIYKLYGNRFKTF